MDLLIYGPAILAGIIGTDEVTNMGDLETEPERSCPHRNNRTPD